MKWIDSNEDGNYLQRNDFQIEVQQQILRCYNKFILYTLRQYINAFEGRWVCNMIGTQVSQMLVERG